MHATHRMSPLMPFGIVCALGVLPLGGASAESEPLEVRESHAKGPTLEAPVTVAWNDPAADDMTLAAWRPGAAHRLPPVVAGISAPSECREGEKLEFLVWFSEPVTGVDLADFGWDSRTLSGDRIVSVQGSGASYRVGVDTGTGQGKIGLVVFDTDSIHSADGIPLGGPGIGNGISHCQRYVHVGRSPGAELRYGGILIVLCCLGVAAFAVQIGGISRA